MIFGKRSVAMRVVIVLWSVAACGQVTTRAPLPTIPSEEEVLSSLEELLSYVPLEFGDMNAPIEWGPLIHYLDFAQIRTELDFINITAEDDYQQRARVFAQISTNIQNLDFTPPGIRPMSRSSI